MTIGHRSGERLVNTPAPGMARAGTGSQDGGMTRRRHLRSMPALTLVAALALAGCTDDSPSDDATAEGSPAVTPSQSAGTATGSAAPDDDPSASPEADEDAASPSAEPSEGSGGDADVDPTTGALAAVALAAAEADGTPYAIDTEAGSWQVDVAVDGASVEVTVDPTGTEVLGTRDDDLDAEDRAALGDATVQLPEAVQRVVSQTGGTLREADLDADAPASWSVSVTVGGAEQEFDVDTATGEVTEDTTD
jgi:uncharacterized membrane protein YkoI